MKAMPNLKELYIFGNPIKTELGVVRQPLVSDYPYLMMNSDILTLNKVEMKTMINTYIEDSETRVTFKELLKAMDLITLLNASKTNDNIFGYTYYRLTEVFNFFFEEKDVLLLIDNDKQLNEYLELFRELSCIDYEKPVEDERLRRFNQHEKELNRLRGETITLESMITSIQAFTNENVFDLTVYNFYKLFDRIGAFKEHDKSVLYSTVATDVKEVGWYRDTKEEKDVNYMSEEQIKQLNSDKEFASNL